MVKLNIAVNEQMNRRMDARTDSESIGTIKAKEEIPPDEYYDALLPKLRQKFPNATESVLTHAVALVAEALLLSRVLYVLLSPSP